MTDFEIALLKLVARGEGQWSWYEIGMRLPGPYLSKSKDMMITLKRLAEMGYVIHETKAGEARDRWELSPKGQSFLDSLSDM
ncbi:MAG: hypothetical protein IAE83_05695 [Anaerolinea sp.]|nr:hypothetical protein [Anaerolinea sp.]